MDLVLELPPVHPWHGHQGLSAGHLPMCRAEFVKTEENVQNHLNKYVW